MIEIKNTKVYGLEESIVRSGFPMQIGDIDYKNYLAISEQDKKRAGRLAKAINGSGHDNFLKGVIVQFDLKYPQYFTPQLQRYHWVDIVSSQSKMHKLTSVEDIGEFCNKYVWRDTTDKLNNMIKMYNIEKITKIKKELFNIILSNLPMGYELYMGVSTNYLQLKTIYTQRKDHRLNEWKYFCNWIRDLPLFYELVTDSERR